MTNDKTTIMIINILIGIMLYIGIGVIMHHWIEGELVTYKQMKWHQRQALLLDIALGVPLLIIYCVIWIITFFRQLFKYYKQ
jgi:hypothetical protein